MVWVCLLLVACLLAGPTSAPSADGAAPSRVGPVGSAAEVSGEVYVAQASGAVQVLRVGDLIYEGDVVATSRAGSARIRLQDGTILTARELSRLILRAERVETGARYTLELIRGGVGSAVDRALLRGGGKGGAKNAVASVRG